MIRSSFVLILFIISGCAGSSLRLVPYTDFEKKEQLQEAPAIKSTEHSENSDEEFAIKDHSPAEIETKKRSLAEKLEDKVEEIEKNNFEEFKISQRLDQLKHAAKQLTAKEIEKEDRSNGSSNDKNGTGFFIAGLIFAILSLVFFLRSMATDLSDESYQGCVASSFEMIGWILLGAIFGVIAIMFLIIGLAIFIASKENQKNKSSVK